MSLVRIITLTALLFTGIALLPQEAAASSSVGFFLGTNRYHPGYYHYYRPFYRPYFYRPYFGGFYSPYHYGYGYGGYGGYGYGGYGYGYPGSYYRGAYLAEIRTEVKPEEARVYLDGDYVGVVDDFDGWWQRLEVPPGRHRLTFRSPGFAPYVIDLRVFPGRDAHIKYEMRPGQDQIADLEMRLPREEYEQRDEGRDRRDRYEDRDRYQRRDSYRDRSYRDRYQRRDRDRYDDRDRDKQYGDRENQYDDRKGDRYQDKPYFGEQEGSRERDSNRRTFTLNIAPPDATVYIDGNYYGTANDNGGPTLQVLLAEGVHRIEVVRPGYSSFSQDITVSRSSENRLSITLQKK